MTERDQCISWYVIGCVALAGLLSAASFGSVEQRESRRLDRELKAVHSARAELAEEKRFASLVADELERRQSVESAGD